MPMHFRLPFTPTPRRLAILASTLATLIVTAAFSWLLIAGRTPALLQQVDLFIHDHWVKTTLQFDASPQVALLAIDPELWLLDEPLASGMDPQGLAVLRAEVRKAAGRGRTVLFTTQILEVAERLADRACVLHKGSLHLTASIAQLRSASTTGTDGVLDALLQGLRDP